MQPADPASKAAGRPPRAAPRRRGARYGRAQLLALAYLLAMGTVVAVIAYALELRQSAFLLRQGTLDRGQQHATEMADVVARQMEAILKGFDMTLLQLRTQYSEGTRPDFERAVSVALEALKDQSLQGAIIVDATGRVAFSSISSTQKGVYLGDRQYVAQQAESDDDRLIVSQPVRSRLLESWSIPLSRPILENGRYQGVVVLGIGPEYFARRLSDPRLSQFDVVGVIHPDGSYLARNRDLAAVLGTRVPGSLPFIGPDAPARGQFRVRARLDGRQRSYAWQRVPGFDIVVTVGIDEETLFAPIEQNIGRDYQQGWGVSALILILGFGTSALLFRSAGQQRLLEESERRYRSTFEENSTIKLLVDPEDGRLCDANAAAVTFYGYPRDRLLSMSITDIDGRTAAEAREHMERAGGTGQRQARFIHRLAGGELRHVEVYSGPVELGRRSLLFLVIHDVTARLDAERKLRLAASLFAHTREGIFYCDAKGIILDVNEAFTELTGYSRRESVGKDFRFFNAHRQDSEFLDVDWSLLQGGSWRGEVWNRHKSGEVYAGLLSLSAIVGSEGAEGEDLAYVGIFSDITSMKESESRLQRLAYYDALTGLPNRNLFMDRLQQALAVGERKQELLVVAFLDLDEFKPVNDTYGHQAGDDVLAEVARRLVEGVRSGDTVCRMGGDEFVLLLHDLSSLEEAGQILDRLREALTTPYRSGQTEISGISASIGYACHPEDAAEATPLVTLADGAMYEAKRSGRNAIRRCRPMPVIA